MKRLIFLALVLLAMLLPACSADDPLPEDIYTKNIYPSSNITYGLGSPNLTFLKGFFYTLEVLGENSLRVFGNTYTGNITPINNTDNFSIGSENYTYYAGYFKNLYLGGEPLSSNATGMTAHNITGEYHIFPENPQGYFLRDDDTWQEIEGGTGNMTTHGNEYHNPDFATETDFTAHTDNNTIHHEHANKSVLDQIQEAFTTALKSSYDWLVSNITAVWKASVDSLMTSTINGYNITDNVTLDYADVGAAPTAEGVTNGNSHDHSGGDGGTISYNSLADKPSILSQYTDEMAQDAVGGMVSDTTTVDLTYTDGTPELKADLVTEGVQDLVGAMTGGTETNITVTYNDATGMIDYVVSAGGGESESVVVLGSDVSNATVNLANATGLSFSAAATSTYIVEVFLLWDSSATAVGIKVSATATNSPTIQAGHFITDAAGGTPDSSSWNANDVVVTTSASPFTTYNLGKVEAIIKTGANASTWQLRFAAETTGTITLKAGSVLRYRKVA